jgi:hypothetical protein
LKRAGDAGALLVLAEGELLAVESFDDGRYKQGPQLSRAGIAQIPIDVWVWFSWRVGKAKGPR